MTQQRIKPAYAKFDPAHVFDGLFGLFEVNRAGARW